MRRLGWALCVMGCGPLVEVGETSESSGDPSSATTTVGTSTSTSTSTGTSTGTSTTTTASTTVATTATDTDDPTTPGFCQAACGEPIDCCKSYAGDPNCQNMFGQYPYRFGCEGGVCQFLGCQNDDECTFDGALMGYICVQLEGYGACFASCAQDQDCEDQFLPGWVCGNEGYCVPPPCFDDSDCTTGTLCDVDLGQCVGGCTSDEQCAGYGVCDPSSHTCVCTSSDECADGFTCAPA